MAHRKPRAMAVAPFRTVDDRQQGFGRHFADALEAVFQPALLGGHLRALVGVLRGAAAADPEVRAARFAPAWRRIENRGRPGDVELALAGQLLEGDSFTGESAL